MVPDHTFLIAAVTVAAAERLSPSYARIEFTAPALDDFGADGPMFDQRIKLIFPGPSGRLPDFGPATADGATNTATATGSDWYATWLALPKADRGVMRTYSVRELRRDDSGTRLVVDFVLHLTPGAAGPAADWAAKARPGDRVIVIGPRRGTTPAGIEFAPGNAARLLLCGDETAVPAISRILGDLPDDACGTALLEVPHDGDAGEIPAPAGVDIVWLPRGDATVGTRLIPATVARLGGTADGRRDTPLGDDDIWETPASPTADAPLARTTGPSGIPGLYAWIAGESGVVTALRRHLVRELGVDRHQVAFMGYWRVGVAMRG